MVTQDMESKRPAIADLVGISTNVMTGIDIWEAARLTRDQTPRPRDAGAAHREIKSPISSV